MSDTNKIKSKLLPSDVSAAEPPRDHLNLIYVICLILGLGTLLAYNCMITASDYFKTEYPDYKNIMFWMVPAYSVPNIIFTFVMVAYGERYSFSLRILSSFIITGFVVVLIPFFAQDVNENPSYDLIMLIAGFVGFSTAVLQATTIGFCGLLPSKYITANIAGQSIAGILACIIRILTKAFEQNNDNGYIQGGLIYFITGGIVDFICAISFFFALRTVFVNHHLQGYFKRQKILAINKQKKISIADRTMNILARVADEEEYGDHLEIENEIEISQVSNSPEPIIKNINIDKTINIDSNQNSLMSQAGVNAQNDNDQPVSIQNQKINKNNNEPWKDNSYQKIEPRYHLTTEHDQTHGMHKTADFRIVWGKVQRPAIALFMVFVVTFLIFPGLIAGIDSQYSSINNGSWMPVILITEFNICDYIGRQFLASMTSFGFNANTLWIASLWRIWIYPLFICLYEGIIINDIVAHISMILLSITNGHFCCLAFIYAPKLVEEYEQETSAAIMSFALVLGIGVGAFIAVGISYLL